MNEERILQNLAAAARGDGPPAVDVADRVVASLRIRRKQSRLVVWFATGAAAAAMVVAVLAVQAMTTKGGGTMDGPDIGMIGSL